MKLSKLLAKGRHVPIIEPRAGGDYIVGYERKNHSPKHDKWMLKTPVKAPAKGGAA
jgi:hypothetical protein